MVLPIEKDPHLASLFTPQTTWQLPGWLQSLPIMSLRLLLLLLFQWRRWIMLLVHQGLANGSNSTYLSTQTQR